MFHDVMQLSEPIEKRSVGPVYFAYTGFARVVIHAHSRPVAGADTVLDIARKLVAAIGDPIEHAGQSLTVGVSVGAIFVQSGIHRLDRLLDASDSAMYEAKRSGKNQVSLGRPAAEDGSSARWNTSRSC